MTRADIVKSLHASFVKDGKSSSHKKALLECSELLIQKSASSAIAADLLRWHNALKGTTVDIEPEYGEDLPDDTGFYAEAPSQIMFYDRRNTVNYGHCSRQEMEIRLFQQKPLFDLHKDYPMNGDCSSLLAEYFQNPDVLMQDRADYIRELTQIVTQLNKLTSKIQFVQVLPAYQEEKNIFHTLENFAKAEGSEKVAFIVLENNPSTSKRDGLRNQVKLFRKQYPGHTVYQIYKCFSLRNTIGMIKKYAADVGLLLAYISGVHHNMIISLNDADCQGADKNYYTHLETLFRKNPAVDAVEIKLDFVDDFLKAYPNLWILLRVHDYGWMYYRHQVSTIHEIRMYGCGAAIKMSSFLMIKGYNPRVTLAEDLEISWQLAYARSRALPGKKYFLYSTAGLKTSPRRFIEAYLNNVHPYDMYAGFDDNQSVRELDTDDLIKKGPGVLDVARLETDLQRFVDHWVDKKNKNWFDDNTLQLIVNKALKIANIEYTLSADNKIKILSIDKLKKSMSKR